MFSGKEGEIDMADKVKVIITDDQKTVRVPSGVRLLIRRCCHAVLLLENFTGSTEISVRFVDNEMIRALNAQYRNIDSETDVLSFPLGENGVYDQNPDTGAYMLYLCTSSTWRRSCISFLVSREIRGEYEFGDTIVYSGFTSA